MLDENICFNYINNQGKLVKYEIIDRFNKDGKNYIIYEEENKNDIYAALYEMIDNNIKIIPITENKDYDIVDKYLENL